MKNTFTFALVILLFTGIRQSLYANYSTAAFNKLTQINPQWPHNQDGLQLIKQEQINACTTEREWISFHLTLVEKTLRNRNVAQLSNTERKNRLACLNNLQQYIAKGVFPINDYLPYRNPVFIDRAGTYCAVGYLMMTSGSEALARNIDAKQKFAYINQITVTGVNDWAHAHGFTLQELAWIQPCYSCVNSGCAEGTQRNVSCYGGNDGCVGLDFTGITVPPYTYDFYQGHDTLGLTGGCAQNCDLPAGDYTLLIIDGAGTRFYRHYTITQPDSLASQRSATPAIVTCMNGAEVHVSGGTPGYSYLWSNGETDSVATNLCPGKNWVDVTDMNGCLKTDTIMIEPATGVNEVGASFTGIFPNPATNIVKLQGLDAAVKFVALINASGQKLMHEVTAGSMNIESLAPGIYTVTLPSTGYSKRLVKL